MVDWQSRFDELNLFLRSTCSIDDSEAVAILCAAALRCPRTKPVWLIIETNWFARHCENAWFSFGGYWQPRTLAELRSMRPRQANQTIVEWLDELPQPHLFVEADFERLPHFQRLHESRFLLARSLRVRTMSPRSPSALPVDEREQTRRGDILNALIRSLVEDRAQARPADPPTFHQPASFLYHCEILQRLSPWYPDWDQLITALASLAIHHAHLFGRSETTEADFKIMARVAADSVPPWIHRLVHYLDQDADPHPQPTPTPITVH
jgi:hypothetical protein